MEADVTLLKEGLFETVEQYADEVLDFSSQYGSDNTISYTAFNVIGKPSVYPFYGDFTQTFALRTYGPWSVDLHTKSRGLQVASQDFLELKFHRCVFPFRVDIYETYNPGAVVRILARDASGKRWAVLWTGRPQIVPPESRIFSPPLERIDFQSNIIRLEFHHSHLHYHYELDAVVLAGSSIISFLRNMSELKSEVEQSVGRLDRLPGEVLNAILSLLDLESLCKCACVSKLFRKYCYDPILYKKLNLQLYWHKVRDGTLTGLVGRCSSLHSLTLNWCAAISADAFIDFLGNCGSNLKCLELASCPFVTSECLKAVADFCPFLTELSLRCCRLDKLAVLQISRLTSLRRLDLYRSPVDALSVIRVLRCCTDLEILGLGSCLSAGDEVALEIGRCSRRMQSLDLWRAKSLSANGVRALADGCPALRELDLGWCLEVDAGTGCIRELVGKCTGLKRLLLTSVRTLSDDDLSAIAAQSKNLEQLDVLGSRDIGRECIYRVLSNCHKLRMLDVSFCGQIDEETIQSWRAEFPHIDFKKSIQTLPLHRGHV